MIEQTILNFTFDIDFEFSNKHESAVYIAISDNLNCLPTGNGLIFKINSKAISVRQPKQLSENLVIRFFTRAFRYVQRLIGRVSPSLQPTPIAGWQTLMPLVSKEPISFTLINPQKGNGNKIRVFINDMEKLLLNLSDWDKNRVITLACYKADVSFRNIRCNN